MSNAMDVAVPSNFVRIMEIFAGDLPRLKQSMTAVSISDQRTEAAMREVFKRSNYVLDPHGAVAYRALEDYLQQSPGTSGILLETAHPIKFESVERMLRTSGSVPASVKQLFGLKERVIEIDPSYGQVKEIISAATA